ncbi:AAA family ATPase [Brachybacterium tyrofermentans]|uniref:AAA family ATPase n=1 Tax=Brachybacterium tyrofermentans TaxID=47848 RepID=UPI003F90329D
MLQIFVSDNDAPKKQPPASVYLQPVEWNDWWEYRNVYYAKYRTQSGAFLKLGQVKIQDPAAQPSDNPKHPLPVGFREEILPEGLVSLGQSDAYYDSIGQLADLERTSFCIAMRDAVWNSSPIVENKAAPAVRKSLLREVALTTVRGEWSRTLRHDTDASHYNVRYGLEEFYIEFIVNPDLIPRTNLHAVVGRNGVGKTTLLRRVAKLLATGSPDPAEVASESLQVFDENGSDESVLAGVQYVSWSAFDSFQSTSNWVLGSGVNYSQIGIDGIFKSDSEGRLRRPVVRPGTKIEFNFLSGVRKDREYESGRLEESSERDESTSSPEESFVRAFGLVIENDRTQLWLNALDALDTDPVFRKLPLLSRLREHANRASGGSLSEPLDGETLVSEFKEQLSDGHKVVLLTTTYLAATLAEQTLVILDEPEAHLHPPLLSSLMRCLSEMLASKNAMAIVATHSPVVLQEVPSNCVWKLKRNMSGRTKWKAERPSIETFGEDVGALTHEVFELEADESGYSTMLQELAAKHDTYEDALSSIGNRLGVAGRSLLRSLIALEHPTHRDRVRTRRS